MRTNERGEMRMKRMTGYPLPLGISVKDDVINFSVAVESGKTCFLCLYHENSDAPLERIELTEEHAIGEVRYVALAKSDVDHMEYNYEINGEFILDPYVKSVAEHENITRGKVLLDEYDWEEDMPLGIPYHDIVAYNLHVRGFTMHKSSKVKTKGTFAGVIEKITYLKDLGINAIELMPIFEFDEMEAVRNVDGEELYNYWGYSTVCFFAPNTSYTSALEYNREGTELRELIRELHKNNIEVILDVVFNHTAEGNEMGPSFSFKGIDNNIYYMLTPDGKYYNFSGCGNVLNCNHPIVEQFILDCLRYWVVSYRVDGFRFDLASIMGRNEDGSPMSKPPLLQSLAFDPILGKVKLIAEAWDAGGLYQVGSFPSWNRWAEWNGRYRDDMRCFLKGDYGMAQAAINRITGSLDLYNPENRGENASVNFINCHDGFTLYDMYAYNCKHNEKNGWNNTDGDNCNNSWNCGVEGETDDPEVLELRNRMRKNAFAILMCSRGSAMFYAGDEFCNTQFGNNNAYCQDNIISWLDWTRKDKYPEISSYKSQFIDSPCISKFIYLL